jgi:hypothetical protein
MGTLPCQNLRARGRSLEVARVRFLNARILAIDGLGERMRDTLRGESGRAASASFHVPRDVDDRHGVEHLVDPEQAAHASSSMVSSSVIDARDTPCNSPCHMTARAYPAGVRRTTCAS